MIGQTFALKYPGMCQSLVLADTTSRRPPDAEQIWGERIRMARAIHENLPGSELLIIKSAAHLSNVEQPQAFNQALTAFLTRAI